MSFKVEILADSISPEGKRLTTYFCRYPRFIHAEVMTHKRLAKSASSSRAIPVEKMIADIQRDPACPVFWGANQKGMQAATQLTGQALIDAKNEWFEALQKAINHAEKMIEAGLHKQIANRILEPWAHISLVITGTEWNNVFALRDHPDAQPEFRQLASMWRRARDESTPVLLKLGEWHLPYIKENDRDAAYHFGKRDSEAYWNVLKQVSAARCARTSYLTHDGRETTFEEDQALFNRLVGSAPIHASPAEHQGTPDVLSGGDWQNPSWHGNFVGWIQHRKQLPNECVEG